MTPGSPSRTPPAAPALAADELLELLEGEGVTHVIGLPDNDTAPLLDMLADHPRVRLVRVAREGEAFAIASGLWLGGATTWCARSSIRSR
jgi:sulfopyruvate decarboxylase TPP-binding subunit